MKSFPLRVKLILAFLLLAILTGGVSYYQVRVVQDMDLLFSDLIEKDMQRLNQLENIRLASTQIEHTVLHSAVEGEVSEHEITEELDAFERRIQEAAQEYKSLIVEGEGEAGALPYIAQVEERAATIKIQAEEIIRLQQQGMALGDLKEKLDVLDESELQLAQGIGAAIDAEEDNIKEEGDEVNAQVDNSVRLGIVLSVGVTLIAVCMGLLTASILARSIKRIREGAVRIGNGDFSRPIAITSHDEFGQLGDNFNQMATRLRESYMRLALQRQQDETMLESMSDGLIALDPEGRIVMINSRASELFYLGQRAPLLGRPIDHILPFFDENDKPLPADYLPARIALQKKEQRNETLTYHRPDGVKIAVHVGISPVISEGQATGIIMIFRDITHEKAVDRMKTEFISIASHQLRTPLSAIKWFSEMLLSGDAGKLTPEQEEFARNVADSTERMIDLVNALLNISRIESGRIIVAPKPTDLSELVNGIVKDLKVKIEERHQNLIISVHKDLPNVNLDPHLIGQVYLNLLTNAIKYTPKGGEISVFISRRGDELISQVTDNGYGIPRAEQGKLFQKFFRATNVAKVETDGTGLGLYLIKAIVESSGGKIWFKSDEGRGTTFWFSVPMSGMKAKEGEVTLDG